MKKIDRVIEIVRSLREDVPVNNVSGGAIAGTPQSGDDPPVKKKKKYIYQKGLRKIWNPQNGGAN